MFCALIILGTYIRIPFPIPLTLQLLFTNTAALLLGAKWGCVPSLLYVMCGVAGLPVFVSGGGVASILSPTFGFTLGFIPGSLLAGVISERGKSKSALAVASAINMLCVYLCGVLHYLLISNFYLAAPTSVIYATTVCVLPFIIPDSVKCGVSVLLYTKLKKHIKQ